jgi:hypothetical protein
LNQNRLHKMSLPLTVHSTTRGDHWQEEESSTQDVTTVTQPAATYHLDNELELHHVSSSLFTLVFNITDCTICNR